MNEDVFYIYWTLYAFWTSTQENLITDNENLVTVVTTFYIWTHSPKSCEYVIGRNVYIWGNFSVESNQGHTELRFN